MSHQEATVVLPVAKTVTQFCKSNGFSRCTLYKMFKAGTGPDVIRVGAKVLITAEAEARWKALLERRWAARDGKAA